MSIPASPFPAPLADDADASSSRLASSHHAPRARALGRAAIAQEAVTHEASLDAIPTGGHARVVSIVLDRDQAAWLSAVGIREGERLTVLRRAAFGGPMHVRTRAGGEFAIARSLARAILVRRADEP
jgi:ferrous iron transport protein A